MRQKIVYECAFCGKRDDSREKIIEHEAGHFNLSAKEYLRWKTLLKNALEASKAVGVAKNRKTDEAFDKACRELADFEVSHGLISDSVPFRFSI